MIVIVASNAWRTIGLHKILEFTSIENRETFQSVFEIKYTSVLLLSSVRYREWPRPFFDGHSVSRTANCPINPFRGFIGDFELVSLTWLQNV